MNNLQQANLWANVADKMRIQSENIKAINANNQTGQELLLALGVFAACVSAAYQDAQ